MMLPGPQNSLSILMLAAPLLLVSCGQHQQTPQPQDETTNEASELPEAPVAAVPMDRAHLLRTVANVASAAALGQDDSNAQRDLDGSRFEVRLRFGCTGGAVEASKLEPFGVAFDSEKRTLSIRAKPDIDLEGLAVTQGDERAVEAIEGFWIRYPWLLNAGCAIAPAAPHPQETSEPTTEARQNAVKGKPTASLAPASDTFAPLARSVGIAQFFTQSDPRTVRRNGRAYEIKRVLKAGELPSAEGYNLVLAGRLRSPRQGKVIACKPRGSDTPPECMVSVAFDRVWIENPANKSILAEWS